MLRWSWWWFGLLLTGWLAAAEPAETPPRLIEPEGWTMVVVPDTQTYFKLSRNQGIFELMAAWMVENAAPLRIRQVLFTGDLIGYNGIGRVRPGINDRLGEEQWRDFSRAMTRLDGRLPYVLCTGNHDYGVISSEDRRSFFGDYFPTDRNPLTREQLIECAPNAFGEMTLENAAYAFTAPDGRKFLVISLEFAPTDADLTWAGELAARPEYRDHFGILLTHSYLAKDGRRIPEEPYGVNRQGGNAGEAIFQKLVAPSSNLRLVVCGHIAAPDDWAAGVVFSTDRNTAGKTVAQMAFNTQAIGGGWHGSGGDGWLRLLEFSPDGRTIRARTFSPLFAVSPATRHLAWRREPRNEFTFTLD